VDEERRADRKADRVADDLLRRIVAGELHVGDVLPKEDALAAHYDVNRSVIREAIKLLEVHRLVRPVRRRGTEVLDPMASMSPEVLLAMLSPSAGRVDRAVLADFLEVRAVLDEEMSALAAERRTDEDLARLDEALAELRRSTHDRARYERANLAFDQAIARASHNRIYEMLVWWHQTIAGELGPLFRVVRPALEPHLEGLAELVERIRQQRADEVRARVVAFHEWATPRLLAAAALSAGEPLASVMDELR
jgi:DNA-binding FadR family transcriptional regulator